MKQMTLTTDGFQKYNKMTRRAAFRADKRRILNRG